MNSTANRLSNGNIELNFNIPWEKIKINYEKLLNEFVKKTEIKGFRKGKAPKKLVEEKVTKTVLYEEVLKNLIPQFYWEAVKEQKLKPIVTPKFKIVAGEEKKDWQIQALLCEAPKVKLGDYQQEIKNTLAPTKIWIPHKNKKESKPNEEEKLEKIFQILVKVCKVEIPEILIQEEVKRMLSRLIDQTARVGITIEDYLQSQQKTIDQLKEEYHKQAEELLKLEFILSAIAEEQKVRVSEEEIEKIIQAIPEEKVRKDFQTPEQKLYIRHLLEKRHVIDNLITLC